MLDPAPGSKRPWLIKLPLPFHSAHGGGMELLLNCDIVVASEQAQFSLPEVKRGVVAAQGGASRLPS